MIQDDYLQCRDLSHAWIMYPDKELGRERWNGMATVIRWLVCTRCTTIRKDEMIMGSGKVIRRSYDYPANYLTPPGDVKHNADWYRKRWLDLNVPK